MKVDGLAVVLAIILLPIILVVTFYIHLQVDTIATENQYNTKLLAATYSAMSAFEMNTANEDLSTVADSMRTIIEASNNVFLDTLATSLGMSNASRELLQPYIPAVLYTMYDGYYIYAPANIPVVAEKTEEKDGLVTKSGYYAYGAKDTSGATLDSSHAKVKDSDNAVYGDVLYETTDGNYTTNKEHSQIKQKQDYILKSYVQYSARYVQDANIDVTINYTLDNYLNIVGMIGDVYYTKTGYLIKKGLVENPHIDGIADSDVWKLNEYDAKNKILGLKTNSEETTVPAANSSRVKINGREINADFQIVANYLNAKYSVPIRTITDAEVYLEKMYEEYDEGRGDVSLLSSINEIEYQIQNCKAVAYYISSQIFSNWVYDKLGSLTYGDIEQIDSVADYKLSSGVKDSIYYEFAPSDDRKIFEVTRDPEDTKSNFYIHKLEVIKNSIKYNLNLAISAYTNTMNSSYNFSLPVLEDEEWDKILSNISIVSFMQGWNCGLNIYNNYQMVCSTNNELAVVPSEIYYVESDKFNDMNSTYHRIDCPVWNATNNKFISFKSKEVKYDKAYKPASSEAHYDHRNVACYTCINTGNYYNRSLFGSAISMTDYYERIKNLKNASGSDDANKQTAAYIGIAKERIDTYKTNALPVSQGYKVFPQTITVNADTNKATITNLNATANIDKFLITIAETKSVSYPGSKEPVITFTVDIKDASGNIVDTIDKKQAVLDQKKEQTILVNLRDNCDMTKASIDLTTISPNSGSYKTSYEIRSVKVIYK